MLGHYKVTSQILLLLEFRPHASQKLLYFFISLSCSCLQREKYKIFGIKHGIIINWAMSIFFRYLAKIIKTTLQGQE